MKIEFNADIDTSGHCLRGSQLLAPLCVCMTSYRSQNTAHFRIQAIACDRRGSGDSKGRLEKLLNSYLMIVEKFKYNAQLQVQIFFTSGIMYVFYP